MILEAAVLVIRPNQEVAFEGDFASASPLISSAEGYLSHELLRCIGEKGRYLLLVRWETLESHTQGFRGSPQYVEWKEHLHHYYDPLPTVEHYATILENRA